jgi:hypothetical protein
MPVSGFGEQLQTRSIGQVITANVDVGAEALTIKCRSISTRSGLLSPSFSKNPARSRRL